MVQGVGFRYFVYRAATGLGLTGWTTNLIDGRVRTVAVGERDKLEALIADLKSGPRYATVTDIEIKWSEPTEQFATFEVR